MITVRRLLKSWATPPASTPRASIFCAWRALLAHAERSSEWRSACSAFASGHVGGDADHALDGSAPVLERRVANVEVNPETSTLASISSPESARTWSRISG